MNIFSIIAVGIIGALLSVAVKNYRPEYGVAVGVCTGVIIMLFVTENIFTSVRAIRELLEKTGIDMEYFSVILKVTGISYITRFGAELCRDAGENAIAMKIDTAGKICVMVLTIPIISGFLNIIIGMLEVI